MTTIANTQSNVTIIVPFHGAQLFVVDYNGEPYTPMKPYIIIISMSQAYLELRYKF